MWASLTDFSINISYYSNFQLCGALKRVVAQKYQKAFFSDCFVQLELVKICELLNFPCFPGDQPLAFKCLM